MRTCIVIPCYNEAERLKKEAFLAFLRQMPEADFCFVNDGSRDRSEEVLQGMKGYLPARIEVVSYADNRGKAEAVRQGMLHAASLGRYDAIAFADADLATPLDEVMRLAGIFYQKEESVLVMGSRIERMGIVIRRKLYRHFTGRMFAGVVACLFRLNAYDTQCGAKVFSPTIVPEAFGVPFLSHWLFDIEILLRIRNGHADYNRIINEIPLDVWIEQGESKIRFPHLLKMPFQLCKIYFKYRKP